MNSFERIFTAGSAGSAEALRVMLTTGNARHGRIRMSMCESLVSTRTTMSLRSPALGTMCFITPWLLSASGYTPLVRFSSYRSLETG